MNRRSAVVIATVVAAAFVGGAAALAANSGLVAGRHDHVGDLAPVATVAGATTPTPSVITKYLDPVTGQLSDTPPTTVASASQTAASGSPRRAVEREAHEHGHDDDRHGADDD